MERAPEAPRVDQETAANQAATPPEVEVAELEKDALFKGSFWDASATNRPDYRELSPDEQAEVVAAYPPNKKPIFYITEADLYFAERAPGGTRVAQTATDILRRELRRERRELGKTTYQPGADEEIIAKYQGVLAKVSTEMRKHANPKNEIPIGSSSIGALCPLGSSKAVAIAVGGTRILSIDSGGRVKTILAPQEKTGTTDDSTPFAGRVKILDLVPGTRIVMAGSLIGADGNPITDEEIGNACNPLESAEEAGMNILSNLLGNNNTASPRNIRDLNLAVLDVAYRQTPKTAEATPNEKQTLLSKLALGSAAFVDSVRARLGYRRDDAKAEYKENPTHQNRLKYLGLAAAGLLVTTGGIYAAVRLAGGGIHSADNLLHEMQSIPSGSGHGSGLSPSHIPSTEASHAPSTKASAGTSGPSGNATPDTHPGGGQSGPSAGIDYTLPAGNVLPGNIPDQIHLSDEQTAWMRESTGTGPIGEYDIHASADGTGQPGTPWHTVLTGLKDLGYNVKDMTPEERGKYVASVLEQNGLSEKDASKLPDNFVLHNPSNADAVRKVTEITGADGQPLAPASGSIADQHIAAIRTEITQQVDASNSHQGGQTPTGGTEQGSSSTTQTASPDSSPSTAPSTAPALPAPTTQDAERPEANDNPFPIKSVLYAGGGALAAAGIAGAAFAADISIKRADAAEAAAKRGSNPQNQGPAPLLPPPLPPIEEATNTDEEDEDDDEEDEDN